MLAIIPGVLPTLTRSFRLIAGFCLLALWAAGDARAAVGLLPSGHLDKPALRKAYEESDFEKVKAALESYRKSPPKDATLEEKILTHKYLGIIYATDSATAIRAESHFNQLLELSPNIELVDMYISPKIQSFFDRVKAEFNHKRNYSNRYDELGMPRQPEPPRDSARGAEGKPGSRAWIWWTSGAAAAAGIAAWFFLIYLQSGTETTRI